MGYAEAYTNVLAKRWVRAIVFLVWLAVMGGGAYMFTIVPEYAITTLQTEQAKVDAPTRIAKNNIVATFDTLKSLQALFLLVESTNGQPVNGTALADFSDYLSNSLARSDFFRWQRPDSLIINILGYQYSMNQGLEKVALSFLSQNLSTSLIQIQCISDVSARTRAQIFPKLKSIIDDYRVPASEKTINVSATGSLGFDHDIRTQSTHELLIYVALMSAPITFAFLMPLAYLFGPDGVTIATHLSLIVGILAVASTLGSTLLLGVLGVCGFEIISFGVQVMTTLTFFLTFDWALILYEEYVSAVPLTAAHSSRQDEDEPPATQGVAAMLGAPGGGQAVLLSAAAIGLSLVIMLFCPSPILSNSAVCGLCGLAVSFAAALTLLPAVLLSFNPVNPFCFTWLARRFGRCTLDHGEEPALGLKYLRAMFASKLLSFSALLLTGLLVAASIWSLFNVSISYDNIQYVAPDAPTRLTIERIRGKFMTGYDGETLMMLEPVRTNKTVFGGPAVKDKAFWESAQEFVKDIYDSSEPGSLIGSPFYQRASFFSPPMAMKVAEVDACEGIPPRLRIGPLKLCNDLLWGWQEMVSSEQSAAWVQIIPNVVNGGPESLRWTSDLRSRTSAAVEQGKFRLAEVWSVAAMSLDVADGLYSDLRMYIPVTIGVIGALFAAVFKSLGPAVVVIFNLAILLGSVTGITWLCYGDLPWALPPILIIPIMAIPLVHDAIFFGRVRARTGKLGGTADVYFSLHRFSLCTNLCGAATFSGMMLSSSAVLRMIFVGLGAALAVQQILVRGVVIPALLAAPTLLRRKWGDSHWWLHLQAEALEPINGSVALCMEAGN